MGILLDEEGIESGMTLVVDENVHMVEEVPSADGGNVMDKVESEEVMEDDVRTVNMSTGLHINQRTSHKLITKLREYLGGWEAFGEETLEPIFRDLEYKVDVVDEVELPKVLPSDPETIQAFVVLCEVWNFLKLGTFFKVMKEGLLAARG